MMHKYFVTQGTKILSTFCLVSRSAESEEWRQGQGGQRRWILTVLGPAEKGGTEDPGGETRCGVGVELLDWEVAGSGGLQGGCGGPGVEGIGHDEPLSGQGLLLWRRSGRTNCALADTRVKCRTPC